MKAVLKKSLRVSAYALLGLLGFIVVLLIALRIPAVQTYIAQKATNMVAEKTGGHIRVDKVRINFIDNVRLKGIYVEEPDGDTLLTADMLEVDISIWKLLSQEVRIDKVVLENAVGNLTQSPNGEFNFQYIIDAFSDSTKPVDTTPSNWAISAKQAHLMNVRFNLDMPGLKLNTYIDEADVELDKLDLEKQVIAGDHINISNSKVLLALSSTNSVEVDTTVSSYTIDTSMAFLLPDIGWQFSLDGFEVENLTVKIDQTDQPSMDGFDYNHIDITNLTATINDAAWEGNSLKVNIKNISLRSAEGTQINNLAGDLEFTDDHIGIKGFNLTTPGIQIELDADAKYDKFSDLMTLSPDLAINIDLMKTRIKVGDLETFLPFLWTDSILAPKARQAMLDIAIKANGTVGDLKVDLIELQTNSITQIKLSGSAKGLPDYKNATFSLELNELTTNYQDALAIVGEVGIPKEVAKFGNVSLTGHIVGKLDSIDARDLVLKTQGETGLAGDIKAAGLPDINNTLFTVDLDYLRTTAKEIAPFAGDSLPEMVMKLGNIGYVGTFNGTITDMTLDGLLTTDLGTLTADLSARFDSAYKHAVYDGKVELDTFQLGEMLGTEDLGKVTLKATIKGEGLNIDSLHTTIDAVIKEVEAMNYTYHDIFIGGKMDKKQFNGNIHIDDPNLKFDFDGLVNLDSTNANFSFTATLDTINLHKLNLASTPMGISLNLDVDLQGLSSRDIDGKAAITDIKINDSLVAYTMDSLVIEAFDSDTGKTIEIRSPILNGYIAGKYNLEALPKELQSFISTYINNVGDTVISQYKVNEPQQFDMLLTISNPQPLINIVAPGLLLDTASITGRFDNMKGDLIITAIIPDVRYDSLSINKVTLRSGGRGKLFGAMVMIDTLHYGTDISIPHARAYTFIRNDSLRYGLSVYDVDTSFYRLRLGGFMQQNNQDYEFAFDRPMILNGDEWKNLDGNKLIIAPNAITFDRFGFERGQKRFQFNTPDSTKGKNPLQVSFNNFPLGEISDLIAYAGLDMTGTIDGQATVYDIKEGLDFVSNLKVNNIAVNTSPVGDLSIIGVRKGPDIDMAVVLMGSNQLSLQAKINTKTQALSGKLDIGKIELKVIDPFLKDFIKDSKGYITSELDIEGTFDKPEVKGYLGFNDVSTFVMYAGTIFNLPDSKINITSKAFSLDKLTIKDVRGEPATLTGSVYHNYFKDFRFDLRFNTSGFQFFNKKPNIQELFYGTLVLGVNAHITGTPSLPIANVATSTKKGTKITVSPMVLEDGIQDAPYVIYYNPNSDDTLAKPQKYNISTLPVDLTLNLEVTDDAEFVIVVDAATDDKLDVVAEGNLAVNIPSMGNISIIGGLEIVRGSYKMTQAFLKRTFTIEKGSRIDLSGDPMDAQLKINAIYATNISTYSLIGEQATTLTAQEQSDAKKPKLVEVVLSMRGKLSSPELTFDIRMPDESGISSLANRRLQQIRQDQNELNTQVFAILLMNSFITDGNTGAGGVPGANAALRSVSGFINQQLNRFTSKVKDFSVNIDASSYGGYSANDANNTVTALGVSVSKGLFNNRLEIKAGGDINVESNTGNPEQNSGFTQWAGDFVLEYKLTENGKYRVKVFNTTDYSILYQNNVNRTGVGLTFQHSFSKIRKKENSGQKKQRKEDNPLPDAPSETVPDQTPKTEEQE